jgi:hypothetical protein
MLTSSSTVNASKTTGSGIRRDGQDGLPRSPAPGAPGGTEDAAPWPGAGPPPAAAARSRSPSPAATVIARQTRGRPGTGGAGGARHAPPFHRGHVVGTAHATGLAPERDHRCGTAPGSHRTSLELHHHARRAQQRHRRGRGQAPSSSRAARPRPGSEVLAGSDLAPVARSVSLTSRARSLSARRGPRGLSGHGDVVRHRSSSPGSWRRP